MGRQRGAASTPAAGRTTDLSTGGGGEQAEGGQGGQGGQPVVRELWFIVLMAAIALLLLAIVLGVTLHKALNKSPFTRERPPLVAPPTTKRSRMAVYPTSNSLGLTNLRFHCSQTRATRGQAAQTKDKEGKGQP
ncbi:Usherin [Liparis tanakae]|uniref:Usherin n=1 Tax=Liparis tanakae TaxID=230148 RepID=A0A4Z2H9P5_9TELE|nr:Usherin [Liparis tanakae]